jgi:hypothetical protein
MRNAIALLLVALAVTPCVLTKPQAQSRSRAQLQSSSPKASASDRLGMTCTQILAMSSSDWIAKFAHTDDSSQDSQLRGIRAYGQCYDERTDRLAASLARTRKGPAANARANFRDFNTALSDFTTQALAAAHASGDPVKTAYAALYERQFRYDFYRSYEEKAEQSKAHTRSAGAPATSNASAAATPAASSPAPTSAQAGAPLNAVDPLTKAKNHFGELLDALPDNELHAVHAAFGKVLDLQAPAGVTQMAIYRYAIFALEPAALQPKPLASKAQQAQPFSPPPF